MHVGIQSHIQNNVRFEEALLQILQLFGDFSKLRPVVIATDQIDRLDRPRFEACLTKTDKILDLVLQANIGILNCDLLGAPQIWPHDCFVTVARITIHNCEMLLFWLRESLIGFIITMQ